MDECDALVYGSGSLLPRPLKTADRELTLIVVLAIAKVSTAI